MHRRAFTSTLTFVFCGIEQGATWQYFSWKRCGRIAGMLSFTQSAGPLVYAPVDNAILFATREPR
jgi:hypothetical protein